MQFITTSKPFIELLYHIYNDKIEVMKEKTRELKGVKRGRLPYLAKHGVVPGGKRHAGGRTGLAEREKSLWRQCQQR
jgi:hypothetical protein